MVNILVPAIVDNHLNSKNNAIYSAAIGTIDALMVNLGMNPHPINILDFGSLSPVNSIAISS